MRELLIRYLLGELDAHEQRQLEAKLRESPELRRELSHLQSCFAAARESEYDADDPPGGLAERTTRRVVSCGNDDNFTPALAGPSISAVAEPPPGVLGWSMADLTVAGGVFLAVSMLLFPALRDSRDATRRAVCESNMQQFYVAAKQYAIDHGNFLPCASPRDYAGSLVIRLVNEGYAAPENMAAWMLCPSSSLAEDVRRGEARIQIPLIFNLEAIAEPLPARLCRMASGSYALRLGYVDNQQYHLIRYNGSDREPFMSDEPDFEIAGVRSANHGGYGQNVLYVSGRVAFQTTSKVPGRNDHMFLNWLGFPAAGQGPDDVVLVSGDRTPGVEYPAQSP
jgi:hypothetical protein